jgi:hypothetical protein
VSSGLGGAEEIKILQEPRDTGTIFTGSALDAFQWLKEVTSLMTSGTQVL